MKKIDLLNVWPLIRDGKFGKVAGEGKIKFVKILAKLSPVMKEFDEYRETVTNKLKEDYQDFDVRLQKAQAFESFKNGAEGAKEPEMTEQQYLDFIKDFKQYSLDFGKALDEESSKEVDVTFDKLTSTEFGCFCDSNDFTGSQALQLSIVISDLG